MIDLCKHYGLKLDRRGFMRCPFHTEGTASFKAYPGERGFYCFGCHASGDIITFEREYFGLTFWEALTKLNQDFGLGLPINDATPAQAYTASVMALSGLSQRREAERELAAAQKEYDKALQAFVDADRIIALYAPTADGAMSDEYITALSSIDRLSNALEDARVRLYEAERR